MTRKEEIDREIENQIELIGEYEKKLGSTKLLYDAGLEPFDEHMKQVKLYDDSIKNAQWRCFYLQKELEELE